MISTDERISTTTNHEETFNDLLTYAELLNTPQLVRLYIYILQNGPVAIETIKTDLDMAHSTTYISTRLAASTIYFESHRLANADRVRGWFGRTRGHTDD
ncbi:hypothetical protein [Haladaptatus sp. DFWS20]|uniref:hypothetical protein n=1 Tax=Haladaptatus sp. DFWS20 TaxID=3403467 RepID=UPI003EBB1A13